MSDSHKPLLESTDPTTFNSTGINPPKPPITPLLMSNPAPLAKIEPDEVDSEHHGILVPLAPFTGIDDGFFDERSRSSHGDEKGTNSGHADNGKIPEFEVTTPSTPDLSEIPEIGLRFGEDDGTINKTDNTDGTKTEENKTPIQINRNFLSPTPQFDFEAGSVIGSESIPDVNIYQHKKTLAQGMMDLALFSANANQLRYVVESSGHPYYYPSLVLITFSLIMQVSKFSSFNCRKYFAS